MTINEIDLNIDTILENWEVEDAVRELIANAIDETLMSRCIQKLEIKYINGQIKIQDFGRGIESKHFIQNENNEKKENDSAIGIFGIGLKDAIAVLTRYDKKINIYSQFGSFYAVKKDKSGVSKGIETIHMIHDAENISPKGTLIVVDNIDEKTYQTALKNFIEFKPDIQKKQLKKCNHGDLYEKDQISEIYFNGMKISDNQELLFSYNITKPDADLKKSINRERKSISIDKYSKIIIRIISEAISTSEPELVSKIYNSRNTDSKTEWIYIDVKAKVLRAKLDMGEKILITNDENRVPCFVEYAYREGYEILSVNDSNYKTLSEKHKIPTLKAFGEAFVSSYDTKAVLEDDLSGADEKNWKDCCSFIEQFSKHWPALSRIYANIVFEIVDELPNANGSANFETLKIKISKSILCNKKRLISVLLHEVCHLTSGFKDVTLDFENALTGCLGELYDFFINTTHSTNSFFN